MIYDTSIPIYLQVMGKIKRDLVCGRIRPGDKLPSGRELAVLYKINPNTAARVYQMLEQEGVCSTRRGLGTFVSEDEKMVGEMREEMAKEAISYFLKSMEELGFSSEEIMKRLKEEL